MTDSAQQGAVERRTTNRENRGRRTEMTLHLRHCAAIAGLLITLVAGASAFAQKQGGILRSYMLDSPASMSIHEESTVVAERPVMGVFNNLVLFDQHVKQNTLDSIVPDLATSLRTVASVIGPPRSVTNRNGDSGYVRLS